MFIRLTPIFLFILTLLAAIGMTQWTKHAIEVKTLEEAAASEKAERIASQREQLSVVRQDEKIYEIQELQEIDGKGKSHGAGAGSVATDLKHEIEELKQREVELSEAIAKEQAAAAPPPTKFNAENVGLGMKVGISFVSLGCALYIILARRFQPKDKHWAFATVGTILGYWLRQ